MPVTFITDSSPLMLRRASTSVESETLLPETVPRRWRGAGRLPEDGTSSISHVPVTESRLRVSTRRAFVFSPVETAPFSLRIWRSNSVIHRPSIPCAASGEAATTSRLAATSARFKLLMGQSWEDGGGVDHHWTTRHPGRVSMSSPMLRPPLSEAVSNPATGETHRAVTDFLGCQPVQRRRLHPEHVEHQINLPAVVRLVLDHRAQPFPRGDGRARRRLALALQIRIAQ